MPNGNKCNRRLRPRPDTLELEVLGSTRRINNSEDEDNRKSMQKQPEEEEKGETQATSSSAAAAAEAAAVAAAAAAVFLETHETRITVQPEISTATTIANVNVVVESDSPTGLRRWFHFGRKSKGRRQRRRTRGEKWSRHLCATDSDSEANEEYDRYTQQSTILANATLAQPETTTIANSSNTLATPLPLTLELAPAPAPAPTYGSLDPLSSNEKIMPTVTLQPPPRSNSLATTHVYGEYGNAGIAGGHDGLGVGSLYSLKTLSIRQSEPNISAECEATVTLPFPNQSSITRQPQQSLMQSANETQRNAQGSSASSSGGLRASLLSMLGKLAIWKHTNCWRDKNAAELQQQQRRCSHKRRQRDRHRKSQRRRSRNSQATTLDDTSESQGLGEPDFDEDGNLPAVTIGKRHNVSAEFVDLPSATTSGTISSGGNLRRLSQARRRRSSYYFSENERRIRANDKEFNAQFKYHNNYIKTSKYSLFTFLPFNLLEQFQRLANFYFLCLLVLQLIPAISSLTPVTTAIPLIGVLTLTAVKDAYDDIQRHISDSQVNNRKSKALRNGKLIDAKWSDVQVGDVIRLDNNQFVAADILLLTTSEPNGLCFIETAELDGETNLKCKQCLPETIELGQQHDALWNFNGEIICERPNNLLNKFEGTLIWRNHRYALDNDKILLRGCVLRNTQWCYGVVVFAGVDTKLMQNSGKTQFKSTGVDRLLNYIIIGIVLFLISICALHAVACAVWELLFGQYFQVYLPWENIVPKDITAGATVIGALVFFSYAIVLNTVVPISLYVSVEVIRFVQSFLINWDELMYDPRTNTYAKARTTTLNEELGQIQYIFSDKTGTLTQNIMTFNKCSINGKSFGDLIDARTGEIIEISDNQTVFQNSSTTPTSTTSTTATSTTSSATANTIKSPNQSTPPSQPQPPTIVIHQAEVHPKMSTVIVRADGETELATPENLKGNIANTLQKKTEGDTTGPAASSSSTTATTKTTLDTKTKRVHYFNSPEDLTPESPTTSLGSRQGEGGARTGRPRRQMSTVSTNSSSDKVKIFSDTMIPMQTFNRSKKVNNNMHVLYDMITVESDDEQLSSSLSLPTPSQATPTPTPSSLSSPMTLRSPLSSTDSASASASALTLTSLPNSNDNDNNDNNDDDDDDDDDEDETNLETNLIDLTKKPQRIVTIETSKKSTKYKITNELYSDVYSPLLLETATTTARITKNNEQQQVQEQDNKHAPIPRSTCNIIFNKLNSKDISNHSTSSYTLTTHATTSTKTTKTTTSTTSNTNTNTTITTMNTSMSTTSTSTSIINNKPSSLRAAKNYLNNHTYATTNWSSSKQRVHAIEPVDFSKNPHYEPDFRWYDRALLDDVRADEEQSHNFFRLLALCHTVMAEVVDGKLEYQAQSPDESALVSAARNFGFVFRTRTPNSITIEVMGETEEYELLNILDFNNVRKRMSVILRRNDKVVLYCKGADNVIYDRLHSGQENLKARTQDHLNKFAGEGLRTLVLAERRLSAQYYSDWRERQQEAALSLDNREQRLNDIYEEIESDMSLVGVTAIEDKLQDGVPRSIANLQNAGIKIWVLTGDKQETAINIGYSCQLLTDELADVFIVDGSSVEEVEMQLRQFKESIKIFNRFRPDLDSINANNSKLESFNGNDASSYTRDRDFITTTAPPPPAISVVTFRWDDKIKDKDKKGGPDSAECNELFEDGEKNNDKSSTTGMAGSAIIEENTGFALVVNGHSLVYCLSPELEAKFLEISSQCKAVICCRVTPLQKALVVELIKRAKNAVTLAIGDGANDVSMIKAAHIGVGISGQEGLQAVLASDYSIAQFRFLERLLLVHGRWSYYRMCKFLRYFFYKNFAFTLCHCWYSIFCGFSAQTVFDPMFISVYNLFYTSLPVLALGVFEQDVSDKNSIEYPRLYTPGLKSELFNIREFIYSVLHGAFTSLVLFLIPYGTYIDGIASNGLILSDHMTLGAVVATILIVDNTAQIALYTSYWTIVNHVTIWGSLFWYFVLDYFYNYVVGGPYVGSLTQAIKDLTFWVTMLLTVSMLMAPVLAYKFYLLDVKPSLSDKIRKKLIQANAARQLHDVKRTPSARRARRSVRSGYAFAHQEGFGRLITSGKIMHKLPQDLAFPLGLGSKKQQTLHNTTGSASSGEHDTNGKNINNNNNSKYITKLDQHSKSQIQNHTSMADTRSVNENGGIRPNQNGTLSPKAPCQDLDTINL